MGDQGVSAMDNLQDAVRAFTRLWLTERLEEHGGCRAETARAIGMQRTYLLQLIRVHRVAVPAPPPGTIRGRCSICRGRGHNRRNHAAAR